MSDETALLAAIRAAPADDAPRLVYADWLDEHGQPERAEFIRVQCELARSNDPGLRRREAELLAEHHDAFAGPLAASHLRFRFERGIPVAFGHTGIFAATDRLIMGTELRFRQNGLVEYAVDRTYVYEGPFAHWQGNVSWPTTRYLFWVDGDHAEVDFEISDGSMSLKFHGWLWNRGLCFELTEGGGFDRRVWIQDFIHQPIPDVSSFPET